MFMWWESLGKGQAGIIAAIVGAILGLFAGLLKSWLDERLAERRLRYEQKQLRQEKVIDAQSSMLDELADIFWKWRYLSMRVAYYGCGDEKKEYNAATEAYRNEIWDILNKIELTRSRMRRLFSESSFEKMRTFCKYVKRLDAKIYKTMQEVHADTRKKVFGELNQTIHKEVTSEIDNLLLDFAHDASLASAKSRTQEQNAHRGKSVSKASRSHEPRQGASQRENPGELDKQEADLPRPVSYDRR